MAIGWLSSPAARAAGDDAAPSTPTISTTGQAVDFASLLDPTDTALHDPQPPAPAPPAAADAAAADAADAAADSDDVARFTFTGEPDASLGPPVDLTLMSHTASAALAVDLGLSNTPMAPLPPAVVAGPIGIAAASWLAWRAKRRGGRI
jgi:hypothetical protein